jgi:hypothetical protein
MPLQNRVTPFGEILALPERGLFTGNRGIIHDPATRTLLARRWAGKAWIVCPCEYKGMRREVMGERSWTELFFLDEATALAAGHRPCFFCRREAANRFRACWAQGTHAAPPSAPAMDRVLHAERLDGKAKRRHPLPRPIGDLPDGAMIAVEDQAFAVLHGEPFRWTPAGYQSAAISPKNAQLLTPPSTVKAFAAGYRPVFHPSLASASAV